MKGRLSIESEVAIQQHLAAYEKMLADRLRPPKRMTLELKFNLAVLADRELMLKIFGGDWLTHALTGFEYKVEWAGKTYPHARLVKLQTDCDARWYFQLTCLFELGEAEAYENLTADMQKDLAAYKKKLSDRLRPPGPDDVVKDLLLVKSRPMMSLSFNSTSPEGQDLAKMIFGPEGWTAAKVNFEYCVWQGPVKYPKARLCGLTWVSSHTGIIVTADFDLGEPEEEARMTLQEWLDTPDFAHKREVLAVGPSVKGKSYDTLEIEKWLSYDGRSLAGLWSWQALVMSSYGVALVNLQLKKTPGLFDGVTVLWTDLKPEEHSRAELITPPFNGLVFKTLPTGYMLCEDLRRTDSRFALVRNGEVLEWRVYRLKS